ncbi:hypothetical protein DLAC_07109 [Tieghemostelium lacteum]|uniref:WAP domain-containing protein n=1 Tax=Tieghemostelium lacteum TaxID=361077 RepID=A0A151ZE87_TIELA|nr:hypothetical protein DLAC_07109 [Tieghemostelium lacteum]|eukprot:KYQ92261.1 hypothetical protein DLAC_07109 [Tieghemostelium lacteum]
MKSFKFLLILFILVIIIQAAYSKNSKQCPEPTNNKTCIQHEYKCHQDSDCDGKKDEKCCEVEAGCLTKCVKKSDLVKLKSEKQCPSPTNEHVCVRHDRQCRDDSSCKKGLKCCEVEVGCLTKCVKGIKASDA